MNLRKKITQTDLRKKIWHHLIKEKFKKFKKFKKLKKF